MKLDVNQYKFEDSVKADIYDTVNIPRNGDLNKFDASVTYMNPKLPAYTKRLKEETEAQGDDASNAVLILCAAATGWHGITENGKPLEFTPENVRKLLGDKNNRWIVDQHYMLINKNASFLASASES